MKVKYIFILGFIFIIIASICSEGNLHPDEHFQLLEFANYKLGGTPAEDLPWEFDAQMRPTFQVAIVYGLCKIMKAGGFFDPFTAVMILRILTGLMMFYVLYLFYNRYKVEIKTKKGIWWFAALTFLLWYVPFVSVRYSSEAFGTIFMIAALVQYHCLPPKKLNFVKLLLVGFLLGISFISRFQMGFMIFGFGLWIVVIKREKITAVLSILLGFIVGIGIGQLCDFWFYGSWFSSAYNYFYQNLVENKTAAFGTSPFWFYASITPWGVFPLYGIIIVPCIIAFFIKYPRHPFTWLLVPFLLIHHIIGHKEMRFLFPITPFVPFIIVIVLEKLSQLKYVKFLKYPFWILNISALIVRSSLPAYDNIAIFKYLYRKADDKPVYFISTQTPFIMYMPEIAKVPFRKGADISMHFYQRDGFYPHAVKDIATLDSALTSTHQKSLLVARTIRYREEFEPELSKAGIRHKVVYNTYHSYFSAVNYYNWMSIDVVGVWTIIEVEK